MNLLSEVCKLSRAKGTCVTDGGEPTEEPIANVVARAAAASRTDEAPTTTPSTFGETSSSASILGDLLRALSVCRFGDEGPPLTLTMKKSAADFAPATVADWTLKALVELGAAVTDTPALCAAVVALLDAADYALSEPVVWWLTSHVLESRTAALAFGAAGGGGGVRLVARRLMAALADDDAGTRATSARHCTLRQLASVAGQVLGYTNAGFAVKRPPDARVDQMINYAPIGQITSSSPMAHHLTTLLPSSPPHRRARTAAWSYHFYPAEIWLDLTVTLPYPVRLSEIHIKPHTPTLNTGPGAVQVELGSDVNASSLKVIGPPLTTVGFSKIRISTAAHRSPVQMLRLHIKRPPDSSNLGLTQILLLGGPAYAETFADDTLRKAAFRFNWLTLLDHLVATDELTNVWQYEPGLAETLVQVLLTSRSITDATRQRLANVLQRIDTAAQSASDHDVEVDFDADDGGGVLSIVLRCVGGDTLTSTSAVTSKALVLLADLVYRLCCESEDTDAGAGVTRDGGAERRRRLLDWTMRAVAAAKTEENAQGGCGEASRLPPPLLHASSARELALPTVVWATACVEWRRCTDAVKHPVREAVISSLCDYLTGATGSGDDVHQWSSTNGAASLRRAVAALLCALSAQNAANARTLVERLWRLDASDDVMEYAALAARNETVVNHLLTHKEDGGGGVAVEQGVTAGDVSYFDALIGRIADPEISDRRFLCLVGVLSSLCQVGTTCARLASMTPSAADRLFMPLLRRLTRRRSHKQRMPSGGDEDATWAALVADGDGDGDREEECVAAAIQMIQR